MRNLLDTMFAGRGGDTLLAHITPREAAILKALGGSGNINPRTGLPMFSDADSGGDTGEAGGADAGSAGTGGGSDSDAAGSGSADTSGGQGNTPSDNYGDAFGVGSQEAQDVPGTSSMGTYGSGMFSDNLGGPQGPYGSIFDGGIGEFGRSQLASFQTDPMGYLAGLAPNPSTVIGYLLGALSPIPGGSLLGAWAGKKAGEYGFSQPTAEDLASLTGTGNEMGGGGDGGTTGGYTAPAATGRTEVAASNVAGTRANYNPDWNSIWSEMAQRGMGGGALPRLFDERVSGLSSLPAEYQPGNMEGIMAQLKAASDKFGGLPLGMMAG